LIMGVMYPVDADPGSGVLLAQEFPSFATCRCRR
jgi:hypothetical protein